MRDRPATPSKDLSAVRDVVIPAASPLPDGALEDNPDDNFVGDRNAYKDQADGASGAPAGETPASGYLGPFTSHYQLPGEAQGATTTPPSGDLVHSRPKGKAPRGYVRSNERIREDVCESLMDYPELDASDVLVEVQDGTVTLSGSVPLRTMKHQIEEIAAACSGVRDVDNRVTVAHHAADAPGGTDSQ